MKKLTVVAFSILILFFIGCDMDGGSTSNSTKGSNSTQELSQEGYGTLSIGLPGASNNRSVPIADIKANASNFSFVVYNDAGTIENLNIQDTVDNAIAEFYLPAGTYRVLVLALDSNWIALASGNAIDVVINENQVTNTTITLMNITYSVTHNIPAQVTCGNEYTKTVTPLVTQEVTGFGKISSVYDDANWMASWTETDGTWTSTDTASTSPGTQDVRIYIYLSFIDPYYHATNSLIGGSLYHYNNSPLINDDVILPNQIEFITGSTPTGININAEWGF